MKKLTLRLTTIMFVLIMISTIGTVREVLAVPVVLFNDNFDTENGGNDRVNYTGFANWDVTDGTVDIIKNGGIFSLACAGGGGACVDLDGSNFNAGRMETKTNFTLNPGIYVLTFDISGNQRGWLATYLDASPNDSLTVSLGSIFSETFTLNPSDPFTTITRSISVSSATSGKLAFDHAGGDRIGIILDNVKLTYNSPRQVPEPSTLILFGSALVGLLGFRRKIRR